MTTLTSASPRTQAILDFIRKFKASEHMAPTVREIQAGCGLSSTSVVAFQLDMLEERGALKRRPRTSRSITLPEEAT